MVATFIEIYVTRGSIETMTEYLQTAHDGRWTRAKTDQQNHFNL